VFEHVTREARPDQLFVEESVLDVLAEVARAACDRAGHGATAAAARRRDGDVSEAARQVIARRFTDNLSLADIGREVGASVFHLARVFRRYTGFSMHAYRTQLRLRTALERIADPKSDLLEVAITLGFSSHSHFTEAFRKNFGVTPSAARASY
jgi:AraC-like DNA-binding protein